MSFDSIKSVEEFYKSYAHKVGFSVYIGSQKLVIDEVMSKKFLCSRQGFKKTNVPPIGKQKNHPISLFRSIINAHKFCTLSLCNGNNGAMVPSGVRQWRLPITDRTLEIEPLSVFSSTPTNLGSCANLGFYRAA
jgi:hypothetical protein